MPAYRSNAETEIRTAVVSKLRTLRPNARIIHEINIDDRRRRADVLAVTPTEIYAVEIKSERDKLNRLTDQCNSMLAVAHHVIAAIHEKHMTNIDWQSQITWWIYPEATRPVSATKWMPASGGWGKPSVRPNTALPHGAITILWRDELAEICDDKRLPVSSRTTMAELKRLLWWHLSGAELTASICAALRKRACIEADAPILEGVCNG